MDQGWRSKRLDLDPFAVHPDYDFYPAEFLVAAAKEAELAKEQSVADEIRAAQEAIAAQNAKSASDLERIPADLLQAELTRRAAAQTRAMGDGE